MAAEVIAQAGHSVDLFDAMPSVGRKFLLAGVGGMNITHAEAPDQFLSRYREAAPWLAPYLESFGAGALREWVHGLGVETFVGSSQRVFPKDMKAAPLLRAWLHRLRQLGVRIHPRHRWQGWDAEDSVLIEDAAGKVHALRPRALVLALGGGSWARLGSDGRWLPWLRQRGLVVRDLAPSNCGFAVNWSQALREKFAGAQLHTIQLSFTDNQNQTHSLRGEAILSEYGLEGSAIYALSAPLRTALAQQGQASLHVDLVPDHSLAWVQAQLARPRGKNSLSNFLRKQLHLTPVKIALLRELTSRAQFEQPEQLARAVKNLPIALKATRPLDEAISSAGGLALAELEPGLMLTKLPGVFCAGEMLDWEAPTGGYLLTACFATGRAAGEGVIAYLRQ